MKCVKNVYLGGGAGGISGSLPDPCLKNLELPLVGRVMVWLLVLQPGIPLKTSGPRRELEVVTVLMEAAEEEAAWG